MTPAAAPASLVLVRHGESTWIAEGRFQGRGDPPLSDVGERQASAVASRLAAPGLPPALPVPDGAPSAIWHSPLARAAQTARAVHVARDGDAPLIALDALAELGQGAWEGLTHDEVRATYPDELAAWRRDPLASHAPGGESLLEALGRARAASAVILGRPAEAPIAQPDDPSSAPPPAPEQPAEPVLGYERRFGPGEDATSAGWSVVVAHDGILRLMMLDLLGVDVASYWSFPFALAAVTVLDLHSGVVRLRVHNQPAHFDAPT
ncbi:histidine phosphatase family protein [soil metagenome]